MSEFRAWGFFTPQIQFRIMRTRKNHKYLLTALGPTIEDYHAYCILRIIYTLKLAYGPNVLGGRSQPERRIRGCAVYLARELGAPYAILARFFTVRAIRAAERFANPSPALLDTLGEILDLNVPEAAILAERDLLRAAIEAYTQTLRIPDPATESIQREIETCRKSLSKIKSLL